MKKNLPVVFSTDDNYVTPLCVTLQSILLTKKADVSFDFYVLNEGLLQENKNTLLKFAQNGCTVNFIDMSAFMKGTTFPDVTYYSIAAFYRFFIPVIFSNYEKVLYLDCDLIARRCISEIFDIDVSGYIFGAVYDRGLNFHGIDDINSGVLIFNVAEYNKNDTCNKLVEYANTHDNLPQVDQNCFNAICKDKLLHIDCKYNFQNILCFDNDKCVSRLKKELKAQKVGKLKNVVIVHYAYLKAWTFPKLPLSRLWWKTVKTLPKDLQQRHKEFALIQQEKSKENEFKAWQYRSAVSRFFYKVRVKISLTFKKIFKKR
ncbi:MAG TPA: hypothetical protein DDY82_00915 [Clostridiales bacterium]|nr:hypothetical protein [Clostridiales bacterium]